RPLGKNVTVGVSAPLMNTSSKYLPAARSARTRAPDAPDPELIYETGMPYFFWKPAVSASRTVSCGGPSTTTDPSALAAAINALNASFGSAAGEIARGR